jgi:hypothetical protein
VRRHPWLSGTGYLTRPRLVPNGAAAVDLAGTGVAGLGLDPVSGARTVAALTGYVQGMAAHLEPVDAVADPDLDGQFEFGLALLLDGLANRCAG